MIDPYTSDALVERLISEARTKIGGYVVTPNVDALRQIKASPGLRQIVAAASFRVADGVPLLWASRLQGTPLPGRVAGSDLIVPLAAALGKHGFTLFLLGGDPGVAELAAGLLVGQCPGLRISGTYCPPFGFDTDPEETQRIIDLLRSAKPDFILIGLPFDKAARLSSLISTHLSSSWSVGVGVSFSFVTGAVRRAPAPLQSLGLEWLYRLYQEPARLARRYLIAGPPFALRLLTSAAAVRLRAERRRRERAGVSRESS